MNRRDTSRHGVGGQTSVETFPVHQSLYSAHGLTESGPAEHDQDLTSESGGTQLLAVYQRVQGAVELIQIKAGADGALPLIV